MEQQLLALLGLLSPSPFAQELIQPILDLPMRQVRQALGTLINSYCTGFWAVMENIKGTVG